MEILDFKRLVESFSSGDLKTNSEIDVRNQEIIVMISKVDPHGSIAAYERHEYGYKQIENLIITDAMYLVKNLINHLDTLKR